MMEKNIKWIIVYFVINLLFIIIPQIEKNEEFKMIIESTKNISINTDFRGITSTEFIYLVENSLEKYPNLKNDYLYIGETKDYIETYKLDLQITGDINTINSFISDLCKIDKIDISEVNIYKNDNNYETDLILISSRGIYE